MDVRTIVGRADLFLVRFYDASRLGLAAKCLRHDDLLLAEEAAAREVVGRRIRPHAEQIGDARQVVHDEW